MSYRHRAAATLTAAALFLPVLAGPTIEEPHTASVTAAAPARWADPTHQHAILSPLEVPCAAPNDATWRVQLVVAASDPTLATAAAANLTRDAVTAQAAFSAGSPGASRGVRWLTRASKDGTCVPDVLIVADNPASGRLADVRRLLVRAALNRDRMIYMVAVPAIDSTAAHGFHGRAVGRAELPMNVADPGARYGVVYGSGLTPATGMTTILHELLHTLGAVNDDAPHATGRGHCYDADPVGGDPMCYKDGGRYPHAEVTEWGRSILDRGGDDYYNVNPAPGSWLADHPQHNVANSQYLEPLANSATHLRVSWPAHAHPHSTDTGHLTVRASLVGHDNYRTRLEAAPSPGTGCSPAGVTFECTKPSSASQAVTLRWRVLVDDDEVTTFTTRTRLESRLRPPTAIHALASRAVRRPDLAANLLALTAFTAHRPPHPARTSRTGPTLKGPPCSCPCAVPGARSPSSSSSSWSS